MTTRYIRKLEKELDCRVMLVASTWRDDIAFDLDETAARRFIDLFDALPHDGEVAVVLWSRGGHVGFADWVVRVLRAKAERVVAVVPTLINGAASMIALSADEIVLHPYGAVGAYDVGPIQYAAPRIDRGNYDDIPALGGLQYDHDPDMPARIAVAANAQRRARQWLDRNRHMDVAGLTLDELGPDTGLSARQLEAAGFNGQFLAVTQLIGSVQAMVMGGGDPS